jgi:hypothetical protein
MIASFFNLPEIGNHLMTAAFFAACAFVLARAWALVKRVRTFLRERKEWMRTKTDLISELLSITAGSDYAPHAVSYAQFELDKARNITRELSSISILGLLLMIGGILLPSLSQCVALTSGSVSLFAAQLLSFRLHKEIGLLESSANEAFRAVLFKNREEETLRG